MRCKKHVTDLSSTIGVCASCLRERLFFLIAAQAQEDRRKSDSNSNPHHHHHPPPLVFPRSVSPYISRRKSDTTIASWTDTHHQLPHPHPHPHPHNLPDHRFYSTPQVGPSGSLADASVSYFKRHTKKNGRFSLFTNLFRSKSDKLDSEISGTGQMFSDFRESSVASSSSSPSWFSGILSGRGKKQTRTFSVDEAAGISGGGLRRVCRHRHPERGMSPARYPEDEEEHYQNESSGYSSESSQQLKQTPRRTPGWMGHGRRGGGGGGGGCKSGQSRNASSGMGFCLSPLVRASPTSRHWNQKGIPPEIVVSGEIRVVPMKAPHLSNAASFCKNRSRKLADFGRFNHNR